MNTYIKDRYDDVDTTHFFVYRYKSSPINFLTLNYLDSFFLNI